MAESVELILLGEAEAQAKDVSLPAGRAGHQRRTVAVLLSVGTLTLGMLLFAGGAGGSSDVASAVDASTGVQLQAVSGCDNECTIAELHATCSEHVHRLQHAGSSNSMPAETPTCEQLVALVQRSCNNCGSCSAMNVCSSHSASQGAAMGHGQRQPTTSPATIMVSPATTQSFSGQGNFNTEAPSSVTGYSLATIYTGGGTTRIVHGTQKPIVVTPAPGNSFTGQGNFNTEVPSSFTGHGLATIYTGGGTTRIVYDNRPAIVMTPAPGQTVTGQGNFNTRAPHEVTGYSPATIYSGGGTTRIVTEAPQPISDDTPATIYWGGGTTRIVTQAP